MNTPNKSLVVAVAVAVIVYVPVSILDPCQFPPGVSPVSDQMALTTCSKHLHTLKPQYEPVAPRLDRVRIDLFDALVINDDSAIIGIYRCDDQLHLLHG